MNSSRRRLGLVAGAVLVLAITATTALAGHITSGVVKSYTGCLSSNDGVITKVKEGNAPKSACSSGQTQVHLSGGDISKISVTGALTGGGDNGEVTIGLKPEFSLPQGCANQQVAKWNGSAWTCGDDKDTTYSPGTGLQLNGTEFFIDQEFQVTNTQACPSDAFVTGLNSSGKLICDTPATGGIEAFSAKVGGVTLAGRTSVLSKTLPAGTYLLFASVELVNQDLDSKSSASCDMPGYATGIHDVDEVADLEFLSLTSAITHSGGPILLACTETTANVDVEQATLVAIKVDSLG